MSKRLPINIRPVEGRRCGECQECCITLGVVSLDKPLYSKCEHQCQHGCSIYEKRPEECKNFTCSWLAGFIEDDGTRRRPDKLGLIFCEQDDAFNRNGIPCVTCWETRENARTDPQGKYLLDKLASRMLVYIFKFDNKGRSLIGPSGLMDKAKRLASKILDKELFN